MFPVISSPVPSQPYNKKIHLSQRTRWIPGTSKKNGSMNTHLPIARRSNGDTKQAVLLTLLPCSSSLPNILSDFCWIRSALQWRDRAGFSPVFPIKRRPQSAHLLIFSNTIYSTFFCKVLLTCKAFFHILHLNNHGRH